MVSNEDLYKGSCGAYYISNGSYGIIWGTANDLIECINRYLLKIPWPNYLNKK